MYLPFDAAEAKGQDGESIRYWRKMEEKQGITHGLLLLQTVGSTS